MEALKEKQQVDLIHCTKLSVETEINKFLRKVVIGIWCLHITNKQLIIRDIYCNL